MAEPDAPASPTAQELLTQLNGYLENTLLIGQQEVRNALNAQGLVSIGDFNGLKEDDIAEIRANARKPGGTVPNPDYNAANPVPGVPITITNPGVLVGHVLEKRLKMLGYYVQYLNKVDREFSAATATLAQIQGLYRLKEADDEYDNEIELPEKLTNVENIRVVLEDLDDYLERKRGVTMIPLAAYTRSMPTPPPVNLDPGIGAPTYLRELIRRAPLTGATAVADKEAVWDVIRHITHDGPGWGWVQAFSRSRDGRGAYIALKSHYFGDAERLRAKANQVLESAYYDGSKRNFTYEKYIESLQRAFTDLESTGEMVSNERKVRILLLGVSDPRLESAKNTILATPSLRANFEVASNYLAEILDSKVSYSASTRKARISSIQHNKNGNGGNKKNGSNQSNGFDPNKYYPFRKWIKLTKEQQQMVREARDAVNSSTKKRSAAAVHFKNGKNKRKGADGSTTTTTDESSETTGDSSENDKELGIGAIMSQRKKGRRETV